MSRTKVPYLIIAALAFVVGFLLMARAMDGSGAPVVGPSPAAPQQAAAERCRAGAREAFSAVASDTPSMTQAEAQAMIDDECSGVSVSDRDTIISAERTAAIARYIDAQATP